LDVEHIARERAGGFLQGVDHATDRTIELADRLVAIVTGDPVNLIESLADRLASACLTDPRVRAVTLTVHKPQAPIAHEFADVAVTLRRERS